MSPRNVWFALWVPRSRISSAPPTTSTVSPQRRGKISLYLNFDMIGSPNHVFFVYDGDDSDGAERGRPCRLRPRSRRSRATTLRGLPFKGTDFSGRSDYGLFIAAGIPSGGLFTGAEGIKTPAEVALWGGTAGQQYDPCYHHACDTYANINLFAYDVNVDAVAYRRCSTR